MDLFYLNIKNFDLKSNLKYNCLHEAGRYILKYAADFLNIENPEIEIINKKPEYKYSNTKFSISHSKDIAAVCFDKNPVGFDIEKIIPRDYKSIAKRMNFEMKENSLKEFYKCWTEYEAKYKLQEEARYIYSAEFNGEYIISVVSNKTTDINKILKIHKIIF